MRELYISETEFRKRVRNADMDIRFDSLAVAAGDHNYTDAKGYRYGTVTMPLPLLTQYEHVDPRFMGPIVDLSVTVGWPGEAVNKGDIEIYEDTVEVDLKFNVLSTSLTVVPDRADLKGLVRVGPDTDLDEALRIQEENDETVPSRRLVEIVLEERSELIEQAYEADLQEIGAPR